MPINSNQFVNTHIMCMIVISDDNSEIGIRHIDVGNYFLDPKGNKCVLLTKDMCDKYAKFITCPIYIYKED